MKTVNDMPHTRAHYHDSMASLVRVPIFQIDAFATHRFAGNPAAVLVLDAFPADALMQTIAAENNLAEMAFLVPEGANMTIEDPAARAQWPGPRSV